MAGTK